MHSISIYRFIYSSPGCQSACSWTHNDQSV